MTNLLEYPSYKLFVRDLNTCFRKGSGPWQIELERDKLSVTLTVGMIWLQGFIEQIILDDILIINDKTGKVKVTNCKNVPGDNSWIAKGVYCSVIGTLVRQTGVPEVAALKLTNLGGNQVFSKMWDDEVVDLKLFLVNKAVPKVASVPLSEIQ